MKELLAKTYLQTRDKKRRAKSNVLETALVLVYPATPAAKQYVRASKMQLGSVGRHAVPEVTCTSNDNVKSFGAFSFNSLHFIFENRVQSKFHLFQSNFCFTVIDKKKIDGHFENTIQ